MPLPLILGIAAAVGAATGVGTGIHGAVKMKDASDTQKRTQSILEQSRKKFDECNRATTASMDKLGNLELTIIDSFGLFCDAIERIQNRPDFKSIKIEGREDLKYDPQKLKEVSVGAGVLLGGMGGAAAGTAGAFAAAGATTSAVMALGTASTGTAIASLSGAAATNATLAALGGGAIAAGGGGIALGTTMLGLSTAGVALLVGGIIFNFAGSKLSDKADEAYSQAVSAQKEANKICAYLDSLKEYSEKFMDQLKKVNDIYGLHLNKLRGIVVVRGKNDWHMFTPEEKQVTQNTVLLAGLLYNMCSVKLVIKAENENELNKVNYNDIKSSIDDSEIVLSEVF